MAKQVMDRRASDNKYLHKDFHCSMNFGVEYVGERFGDEGVREYLTDFTKTFYVNLIEDAKKRGLNAIKEHIEKIYEIEEASEVLHIKLTDKDLYVSIDKCPAVAHIRKCGGVPCKWFIETTNIVNSVIAREAGLRFEMVSYCEEDGKAEYRFSM